jgi:hypothetical protein
MPDRLEEAWTEYQFGKMIDPVHRYEHDDKALFSAGWAAGQKKPTPSHRESVWVSVPESMDVDPD